MPYKHIVLQLMASPGFGDNKKNEYVLVGTLLSFGIATLLGILVSNIP